MPLDTQDRLARREAQRRVIRRRRMTAIMAGGLVILVLLVAAVKLISGGSGSGGGGGGGGKAGSTPAAAVGGTPIGAATPARSGASSSTAKPTTVVATSGLPSSAALAAAPGTGTPGAERVPILMYHVIAPPPPGAPFPGLYVTPDLFAAQMRALAAAGWHAVTLDQVRAYWSRGVALPKGKPIVVSFDNGYQSQYTKALPVLRSLGWAGVENIQLTGLPPSQGGFAAGQIKGLLAAGWELDTQGISHADLIKLSPSDLHQQVAVSRRILQKRYGVPVNWFCYPSGHYDATVVAAVKAAGYVGSTTVVPGWAGPGGDAYRLARLRVLGGTQPAALLGQIAAAKAGGPPPASYGPA